MLYKRTLIAAALLALAAPSWSQDMKDGKAMVDATCNSCHPLTARIGSISVTMPRLANACETIDSFQRR